MKKLISVSYNNIEYFLMNSYSIDAHKSLISKINTTEITLESLKNELKSMEAYEFNRVAEIFKKQFGFDIPKIIPNAGVAFDYVDISCLQKDLGDDWEKSAKKLEDLGFIEFHYMFFHNDNINHEIEISKETFLNCSTPNQNGMCIDPLLNQECTLQEFKAHSYILIGMTDAYADYLIKHSDFFRLKNEN